MAPACTQELLGLLGVLACATHLAEDCGANPAPEIWEEAQRTQVRGIRVLLGPVAGDGCPGTSSGLPAKEGLLLLLGHSPSQSSGTQGEAALKPLCRKQRALRGCTIPVWPGHILGAPTLTGAPSPCTYEPTGKVTVDLKLHPHAGPAFPFLGSTIPASACPASPPAPFPQRTAFSVGCSPSGIALPEWGGFHHLFCEWVKCSLQKKIRIASQRQLASGL